MRKEGVGMREERDEGLLWQKLKRGPSLHGGKRKLILRVLGGEKRGVKLSLLEAATSVVKGCCKRKREGRLPP